MQSDLPSAMHTLLESSRIPLTLADKTLPDTPLVYANSAFAALTGYSPEEVLNRNCRFLQGDLSQDAARAEIRDAIANSHDVQVILRNFRKSGEMFNNLLYLYSISDRHILGSQFELPREDAVQSSLMRQDELGLVVQTLERAAAQNIGTSRRTASDALANMVRAWLNLHGL
ncbi:MAG: PAS domain-containing protein [Mangrovicoccus sp.]